MSIEASSIAAAARAIVALAVGARVKTARPDRVNVASMARLAPQHHASVLVAPRLARLLRGGHPRPAAEDPDVWAAVRLLSRHDDAEALADACYATCELVLRARWGSLRRLADGLRQARALSGSQIAQLLETAPRQPLVTSIERLEKLCAAAGSEADELLRPGELESLADRQADAEAALAEAITAELAASPSSGSGMGSLLRPNSGSIHPRPGSSFAPRPDGARPTFSRFSRWRS